MSNWFKENGFLSDEGKEALSNFQKILENVLTLSKSIGMSEQEIQLLQANMTKMVNDHVSNFLQLKRAELKKFNDMTDEQFEAHLKEVYGKKWMFASLTQEEVSRASSMLERAVNKLLVDRDGDLNNLLNRQSGVRLDTNRKFYK